MWKKLAETTSALELERSSNKSTIEEKNNTDSNLESDDRWF